MSACWPNMQEDDARYACLIKEAMHGCATPCAVLHCDGYSSALPPCSVCSGPAWAQSLCLVACYCLDCLPVGLICSSYSFKDGSCNFGTIHAALGQCMQFWDQLDLSCILHDCSKLCRGLVGFSTRPTCSGSTAHKSEAVYVAAECALTDI